MWEPEGSQGSRRGPASSQPSLCPAGCLPASPSPHAPWRLPPAPGPSCRWQPLVSPECCPLVIAAQLTLRQPCLPPFRLLGTRLTLCPRRPLQFPPPRTTAPTSAGLDAGPPPLTSLCHPAVQAGKAWLVPGNPESCQPLGATPGEVVCELGLEGTGSLLPAGPGQATGQTEPRRRAGDGPGVEGTDFPARGRGGRPAHTGSDALFEACMSRARSSCILLRFGREPARPNVSLLVRDAGR